MGQVWHAEATWQSQSPISDSPEEYDPSRLPPRIFIQKKEARESIEKEIRDLLFVPPGSIPPLKMVHRSSPEVRGMPFVRPTLIVRIKATGVYKARLCLRGYLIGGKVESFSSSPTTHRSSLRVVISCAMILGLQISMLDVTQAFLQSDPLPAESQCAVIVPPLCVLTVDQSERVVLQARYFLCLRIKNEQTALRQPHRSVEMVVEDKPTYEAVEFSTAQAGYLHVYVAGGRKKPADYR